MYFNHNIEIILALATPLCPSPTPVLSTCLKVIVTADVYKSKYHENKKGGKKRKFSEDFRPFLSRDERILDEFVMHYATNGLN